MLVQCVWEHNGNDSLIYADNFIGAFVRGAAKEEALAKFPQEIASYMAWKTGGRVLPEVQTTVIQEKQSDLRISDADSDVLFESEKPPLEREAYEALKALAIRSAEDFYVLYQAVPCKEKSLMPSRETFYGQVPVTARQIYEHTRGVNAYYFGEIHVEADCEGTILECRKRAFQRLETLPGFLDNRVFDGSGDEQWTLRKVCRRFIWHDRIHAKALYRMAAKHFDGDQIPDVFHFG